MSPAAMLPATRRRRKAAACLALAALSGLGVAGLTSVAHAATGPRVYYVSPSGNDAAAGTSSASAWKSLQKINQTALSPGDRVLFQRGGSWVGRLILGGVGTSAAPISVDAYGTGNLPSFSVGLSGTCVLVSGNYVNVRNLDASNCVYSGFDVTGDHNAIDQSTAQNNVVGVHINRGGAFNSFQHDRLINNNRMAVNTPGVNCVPVKNWSCLDDSGATAFLINGDDNDLGYNTVTGSIATSYDFGYDGSAFEIFNANRNVIHDNVSQNNLVLSEIGRNTSGTSNGNSYRNNVHSTDSSARFANAGGITLRGSGSLFGPTGATTIDHNSFNLPGTTSHALMCKGSCPSTTVITNNTLKATRAVYIDGSGWSFHGNMLVGSTVGTVGSQHWVVPAGTTQLH